jgi:hypothetical protein
MPFGKGGTYTRLPPKPSGPNMLDELFKGFIVNLADLPWKWVKRMAASGKRVNNDS